MARKTPYAWVNARISKDARKALERLSKVRRETMTASIEYAVLSAWERYEQERQAK